VDLIPSWEAESCSSSQEMYHVLWNVSYISMFTTTGHLFMSWARLIPS
jgi:hypothetical protein